MSTDNPQIRIIDAAATATDRCQDCRFFKVVNPPNSATLTVFEHCAYHGRGVLPTDRCVKWKGRG